MIHRVQGESMFTYLSTTYINSQRLVKCLQIPVHGYCIG